MRQADAVSTRARTGVARPARLCAAAATAALVLGACGGGDDEEPAADPGESPSSPSASTTDFSPTPTETEPPTAELPQEPGFADSAAGKRAYVTYIVEGWAYALNTNDPVVLLDESGKKPCRGCDSLRQELAEREKEGWYVQLSGVDVRKVTFRQDGEVDVATAVVDIPASQSFFEDGTFRNDNDAHRGADFLIDISADGKAKKRHWTLRAFSIK